MRPEEDAVAKYLEKTQGENVVFEPDGNVPPDFAVNSDIAVEVRRLNQQFMDGKKMEGLEQVSFSIMDVLKEVLVSFDPQYVGKTFGLHIDYERPLNQEMAELKAGMRTALQNFLDADFALPATIQVSESVEFWLYSSVPVNGRVFLQAGEMERDAGGAVISEYIDNIRYCIAKKSSRIGPYRARYKEWWLYLVDTMELGLDYNEIKTVTSAITDLGGFDKVKIVTRNGRHLILDLASKHENRDTLSP